MPKKLKPTRKMQFRRRLEGKTDYKKRLSLLKSGRPRLVVRKSLNYIRAQIVEYEKGGDKTIASAYSGDLKKLGWTHPCDNTPAAYLTGMMLAKEAKEKKIDNIILDMGLYTSTKGSRIYAVVKGMADSGVSIPHDEEMMPSDERIRGDHIASHNENSKDIQKKFNEVKNKLEKGE